MANIVIDCREMLSSTGRYMRKLVENLQVLDTKNEYYLLLNQDGMDATQLTATNFHKELVTIKKFTLAEQLKLPKHIAALKPDLVHFPMPNQPAWLKARVVTTIHDLTALRFQDPTANPLVFSIRQKVFRWLIKHVAHKSVAVVCAANFVKKDVADFAGISQSKVVVTPLAADLIKDRSELVPQLVGKKFIFYVGRAQTHKNLARLIPAMEMLRTNHPELVLAFAGRKSGNFDLVEKAAAQSSVASSVIFTDFISDGQLRWMYENAALYVFPSLSEGFGLPGLEAMIHGCPVASSNATCLPEVYGDAAHYFDPTGVEDIARAIGDVLESNTLRQDLIEKGRRKTAEYSWQRLAKQTLEVYNKALQS